MTVLEEIRQALVEGDPQRARMLLCRLPPVPHSLEEAAGIRHVLEWALQTARLHRAHDAARFAELVRSSAYLVRKADRRSTWSVDG